MTHRGFKITARNHVMNGGSKYLLVKIDGYAFTVHAGRDRDAAFADAARYVDESIQRPDAYTWTRELTAAQLARKIDS